MGFLQQIHSSMKSVPMLLCNCLQCGMILDWTHVSTQLPKKLFPKKSQSWETYCILQYVRWASGQGCFPNTSCSYLVQDFSIPADGEAVLLLFCFVLTTSKLVDTVLGNEKRQCLTPLCGMWQQEPVSASQEADSLSDTALVVRSLLDKWGFVWILQYTHCSGPKERCSISGILTIATVVTETTPCSAVWFSLCAHSPKLHCFFSAGLLQCHLLYNLLPAVISHALSVSPVSCGLTQWKILFSK